MHETPQFGTRPSVREKWIHPWQQEHFNQTGISPFPLARCLQPCANEIFSYKKTRLTDQPFQTKMLLNICSSPWRSIRATHQPHPSLPRRHQLHPALLSSWGWVDPSRIACPRAFTAGRTGSQLHHFKPSGRSFSPRGVTDGPVKLLLLYWWRDERDQSWRSVPDWQLRRQQREKQGKREKQVGKGAEAMRHAQNRILNRWSKIRLLMVLLHLTRKAKRFYKMARCFQPSGPSKKLLQEYMASPRCPALPLYLVQVMGLPTQMRSTVYLHP